MHHGRGVEALAEYQFYRLTMSMFDGPKAIADAAHQAGIPEQIPASPADLTETVTTAERNRVGQYLVRPIDMASAYATIANSGVYQPPYFVQRVVAGDGGCCWIGARPISRSASSSRRPAAASP